jgi:hypothetical protein
VGRFCEERENGLSLIAPVSGIQINWVRTGNTVEVKGGEPSRNPHINNRLSWNNIVGSATWNTTHVSSTV